MPQLPGKESKVPGRYHRPRPVSTISEAELAAVERKPPVERREREVVAERVESERISLDDPASQQQFWADENGARASARGRA